MSLDEDTITIIERYALLITAAVIHSEGHQNYKDSARDAVMLLQAINEWLPPEEGEDRVYEVVKK